MNQYHDMYDRVAKKCLTLSNRAIIQFINGTFGVNHPLDSKVTYNWTEHEDGSITFRIFEYGFHHAIKIRREENVLEFPDPVLICLYEGKSEPDERDLTVRFGNSGTYIYKVPVIKYLSLSPEELQNRNMIILIPFQLLKLKKSMEKKRTKENLDALKYLVTHDIIGSIEVNVKAGNITPTDGRKLKNMTLQLYHHIYDRYQEVSDEGVSEAVEEALILDIDVIEMEHKKELREKEKEIEEKQKEAEEKGEEVKVLKLLLKGKSPKEAARELNISLEKIEKMINS